jgi:glycosyltransferase involved in cell wall biosynthesis
MNNKLSIVICSYNRASYIGKAIKSILDQTFSDFEVIIIDDCSKDNTENIVKELIKKDSRIKYYKNEENLGISKSRNRGISLSNGEYIAMLDSDDYWIDNRKIEKQIEILDKNKDMGLIGSNILCINTDGQKLKESKYQTEDKDIRNKILIKNQFAQSSIIFKKELINKIGNYNEELDVCEDYDLWLKIGKISKLANIKDITTAYLIHSGGISKQRKLKIAKNIYKIINKNKGNYPNYFLAKIVAIIRIIKSYLNL